MLAAPGLPKARPDPSPVLVSACTLPCVPRQQTWSGTGGRSVASSWQRGINAAKASSALKSHRRILTDSFAGVRPMVP